MPEHRYDATRQTIGTLLSTTSPRIEVPDWQRSYSWASDQIDSFWADLIAFDEHYPGNNIVGQEYFLGSIVLVTGGDNNLLLDGQQRLATATILLSALRDARKGYSADAATRLQTKYIADYDDSTNTTTSVLTMNLYDREFFQSEIQDEPKTPPIIVKATLRSHGLIRKARQYFDDRVAEFSAKLGGGKEAFDWNLRVGRVLCNHMSLVTVSSSDEDNAAEVFETLNDRGIGLSTPDLLRNLLLRRAPSDETRNRVVSAWEEILAIADEASVDSFLRHYWVSRRGDVKVRSLYREIKATVLGENVPSLDLSVDLAETASMYRDIARARDDDAEVQRSLEAIRDLGAKALYPVLLSGFSIADRKDDLLKLRALSHALVSMFVRYNVIGGRETTIMETAVYKVAANLRADKDLDAAVAALAALVPDAAEFVHRFAQVNVKRIATARYILREIEHAKRKTYEVAVEGTDRVHVEHIYPQTPKTSFSNHSSIINRLGNLTLLGKRLNTSIQNAEFAEKKEQAYSSSDIVMTQELMDFESWDQGTIADRQLELSEWVFAIWKFPGELEPIRPIRPVEPQTTVTVEESPPLEAEAPLPDLLPDVPSTP